MKEIANEAYIKRAQNKRQELALKYYNGECFICHKKYPISAEKFRFVFHHKWYDNNIKPYQKDRNYWRKIISEIEQSPDQFLLLCVGCHNAVTYYCYNRDSLRRLVEAVNLTKSINKK
jgi:hypothetical protein